MFKERKKINIKNIILSGAAVLLAVSLFFSYFVFSGYNSFAAEQITITYNAGTYGEGSILPTVFESGAEIKLSAEKFTRNGYVQTMWITDENNTSATKYALGSNITVSQNLTLYPVWEKATYKVTFDPDGGTIASGIDYVEAQYDTTINKPTVSKAGHSLDGWYVYLGLDAQNKPIIGNKWDFETGKVLRNVILIAVWEAQEYSITFNSDGGSYTPLQKIKFGSKVSKPPDPEKEGYNFKGWYYGDLEWKFDEYVMPDKDIILKAKWDKYTVSFNLNGGKGQNPPDQTVDYGKNAAAPPNPVRDGCTFKGWYAGNVVWNFSSPVTEDLVLTARWNIEKPPVSIDEKENDENKIILWADVDKIDGAKYSYQWYSEIDGVWVLISGAEGEFLTLSPDDNGNYKCVVIVQDNSEGGLNSTNEASYFIPPPQKDDHIYWVIWLLLVVIAGQGILLFFLIGKSQSDKDSQKRLNSFGLLPFLAAVARSEIIIVSIEAVIIVALSICIIYFLPETVRKERVLKDNNKKSNDKNAPDKLQKIIIENAALEELIQSGEAGIFSGAAAVTEQDGGDVEITATLAKQKNKIKSVDDFYEEESAKIEEEIAAERDPLLYVEKAIENANEINHITALKILKQELLDELERIKKEKEAAEKEAELLSEEDCKKEQENTGGTEDEESAEEKAQRLKEEEEAGKAVEEFLKAKRNGEDDVPVPELRFTLSREDILDYIEDSARHPDKYLVEMSVALKKKHYHPDVIKCGEWAFALMTEKKKVVRFALRANSEMRKDMEEKYTAAYPCIYFDKDGMSFVVDSSVKSKDEVFEILDACYFYTLENFYQKTEKTYKTDVYRARKDTEKLEKAVAENIQKPDEKYNTAITEYDKALKKHKEHHPAELNMTRARFVMYAEKAMWQDVVIFERPQKWYLPTSIRSSGKTCVLAYEKNGELSLTARIPDDYAKKLMTLHPQVKRARFPKGRNWYVIMIDGSFQSAQSVYLILKTAKKFADRAARKEYEY